MHSLLLQITFSFRLLQLDVHSFYYVFRHKCISRCITNEMYLEKKMKMTGSNWDGWTTVADDEEILIIKR